MIFALPFPMIDPVLISFGPFAIRWYALAYIVGILLGWKYTASISANQTLWKNDASPVSANQLDDFVLWVTLGIVAGGRLGYVLFYNLEVYLAAPLEIFKVWQGGMSFHGGMLGVLLAIILFGHKRSVSVLSLADIVTAAAPIGLFFGRIANFINAELWGRVSDVPWAFVFPGAGPLPRHPSQLYQAALEGLVLFILLRILTHNFRALRKPGLVTGVFVGGYGAVRLFVEFFRQPDTHIGFIGPGLTMGMLLSTPMILIGASLAIWAWKR